MVVIDATTLMLFLRPDVAVPSGPKGQQIDKPVERVEFLVQTLEKARAKIVIPAPVLGEVLVRVDAVKAQELIEKINKLSVFRVEPFDERMAIELAILTRNAIDGGNKPSKRDEKATWAKLKYDRQIVATALVVGASKIYSDDGDIRAIAKRAKLTVLGLADLDLPPEDAQGRFPFNEKSEAEDAGSKKKKTENQDQSKAFIEMAKKVEAAEGSATAADALMGRLAKMPPEPKPIKKSKGKKPAK